MFDAPTPGAEEPRVFRLGVVPGATPGKWIDVWKQRMPHVPLELVAVTAADARRALVDDEADAIILREPLDRTDLHAIGLYDEVPVVVVSRDSALTAVDELTTDDLAGEVVITPDDDVLAIGEVAGTVAPRFVAPRTTEDAIATVATGVGVVIVPMSLARLYHRKDVEYRPFVDGPVSPVALAWHADRQTSDIETFIGVVRGRTANSSRG